MSSLPKRGHTAAKQLQPRAGSENISTRQRREVGNSGDSQQFAEGVCHSGPAACLP